MLARIPEQGWAESAITKIARLSDGNPWTQPFAYQLLPFGDWYPSTTIVFDGVMSLSSPYGAVDYSELRPWILD